MNSKILIIGSSGVLGSKLKTIFKDCYCPSKKELDIRNNIINSKFFKNHDCKKIKTIINCAAIKNVEKCEKEKIEALKTNAIGTYNLAIFCEKIKAKLVYISTDYVFKGDKGNYKKNDLVGPINYYGETKLAGEIITKSIKKHLIIRLSFSEDEFPYDYAFSDQIATKIKVSTAANEIFELVKNNATGIRHLVGKKQSVYNFAKETNKKVKKISLRSINDKLRPRNCSLK